MCDVPVNSVATHKMVQLHVLIADFAVSKSLLALSKTLVLAVEVLSGLTLICSSDVFVFSRTSVRVPGFPLSTCGERRRLARFLKSASVGIDWSSFMKTANGLKWSFNVCISVKDVSN